MEMSLIETAAGRRRIRLAGRLDAEGVDRVELKFESAVEARDVDLEIDLREVTFLASMGVRMLVAAAKKQAVRGRKLVLREPQANVVEFLRDAGLETLLPVAADEAQVEAIFGAAR